MRMSCRSHVWLCSSGEKPTGTGGQFARRIAFALLLVIEGLRPMGASAAGELPWVQVPIRTRPWILALVLNHSNPILVQNRTTPSLLKRRDPVPPTLRPTLASANPQGDGDVITCRGTSTANGDFSDMDLRATPSNCVVGILDVLDVSLDFDSGPVDLVLTAPNGTQSRYSLSDRDDTKYMMPGTVLGTYTFVAFAGGRFLRGGYTVEAQSKPLLRVRPTDLALAEL